MPFIYLKKFFFRSETEPRGQYTCSGNVQKKCKITVENRANCKLCRFQKCKSSGMDLKCKFFFYLIFIKSLSKLNLIHHLNKIVKSQDLQSSELIQSTACAVCSELSSGIHFGVATCEACKGFFRRSFNNKSMAQPRKYRCSKTTAGTCEINKKTRQNCRSCRLAKCLRVGMSIECKLFIIYYFTNILLFNLN